MNLNSARFYAYVFFKASSSPNRETDPACECFVQWKSAYDMEEKPPVRTGDAESEMLRLAEKDAVRISLFRFRDTDIFEYRRERTEAGESVSALWEKSAAEFETHLGNIPETISFIGTSRVYFAYSSDLSKNAAKMVAKYCQWDSATEMFSVKVSSLGSLYRVGEYRYLMLSQYGDPSEFLDRDFAIIESVFRRLDYENRRFEEIRAQGERSENQILKLISPADVEEIEKNLTGIRTYQCHLHNSLSLMARLDQTLDMGILDINNYLFAYDPQNDTLFVSKLGKVEKIRKRVHFDLNYLRMISANIDSRIQFLLLTTQSRRLKVDRKTGSLIAAFGSAITMGLMTSSASWGVRFVLMILAALAGAFLIRLPAIEKNDDLSK